MGSGESQASAAPHEKVKVTMYNFGCPRVGNRQFASEYNQLCPDSFRVVVDGDFVTSIPTTGFVHAGTEVVVDSKGAGSIIVDPSFVEQWLRSKVKNSLRVHLMTYYRIGLEGVKMATEFLRQYLRDGDRRAMEQQRTQIVRLAMKASPRGRLNSTNNNGAGEVEIEMTENPLAGRSRVETPIAGSPIPFVDSLSPLGLKTRPIIRQSVNMNALRRRPSTETLPPSFFVPESVPGDGAGENIYMYENRVHRL